MPFSVKSAPATKKIKCSAQTNVLSRYRGIIFAAGCSICSIFLMQTRIVSAAASKAMETIRPVTLITFDVDGTLLHGSTAKAEASVHARAFMHAIGSIFGDDPAFEKKYPSPLAFLPPEKYHGSTDGLIALNLAKYSPFSVPIEESSKKLDAIFAKMYEYVSSHTDEDASEGIDPLPGVVEALQKIAASDQFRENRILCGLVTGNVEGIARKKMRACGIVQTGVLSPKAPSQSFVDELDDTDTDTIMGKRSSGTGMATSFLGGFGTDFCSYNIEDPSRNYKDRGEQIVIAYKRACEVLQSLKRASAMTGTATLESTSVHPLSAITRVIHVGDAPGDILAAKWVAGAHFDPQDEEEEGGGVFISPSPPSSSTSSTTTTTSNDQQAKLRLGCGREGRLGVLKFDDGSLCTAGRRVEVTCIGVGTGKYSAEALADLAGEPVRGFWRPVVLEAGVADPLFLENCGL